MAVVQGEYHWHKHEGDDEFFLVQEGHLSIDLEDRTIELCSVAGGRESQGVASSPARSRSHGHADGRDVGHRPDRKLGFNRAWEVRGRASAAEPVHKDFTRLTSDSVTVAAMGKTAMVTGASGGIGLELAERLAKDGYQLTLVARNEAKLKEIVARLGAGHRALAADLSKPEDTRRVADDVRASHYDVLVNNAGVGVYGNVSDASLETLKSMMRLNIDSLVELSHAYLSVAKSGDALMNVASTLALLALPGATTYCATKAFVTAFSEGLWFENKPRGIYVMGLLPGVTKTNFHEAAGGASDNKPPEAISQTSAQVVDVAMRALAARSKPTVLTSFTNKAMVFMSTRLMPRKTMVTMMGGNSPAKKPAPQLKA